MSYRYPYQPSQTHRPFLTGTYEASQDAWCRQHFLSHRHWKCRRFPIRLPCSGDLVLLVSILRMGALAHAHDWPHSQFAPTSLWRYLEGISWKISFPLLHRFLDHQERIIVWLHPCTRRLIKNSIRMSNNTSSLAGCHHLHHSTQPGHHLLREVGDPVRPRSINDPLIHHREVGLPLFKFFSF